MTREEILELLRNELRVSVSVDSDTGYYYDNKSLRVSVSLKMGDDVITECSDTVSI